MNGAKVRRGLGKERKREAKQAVRPHLQQTPARMTEPAVGASTCASGSQVWNGNRGTLIANASANARKNQLWVCAGSCDAYRSSRLKLGEPVACWCAYASPMMATSIRTLPAIVYRKNLTAA